MPMPSKGMPKKPKRKLILSIAENTEPSMCMVAPRGSTMSLTSRGMPISSAASILAGMVAMELQVPRDVTAGLSMCWKSFLAAPLPPAKRAYRGKAIKKYRTHRG